MIRVPTLTDQHRQDHARVLIMACRLHPPQPACRDGQDPVSLRESLEGLLTDPRKPRDLFFSLESRDRRDSVFSLSTFADRTCIVTTGASLFLLVMATVLAPCQAILKTTALDVDQWLLCAAVALSIIAVTEIRKAFLRRPSVQSGYDDHRDADCVMGAACPRVPGREGCPVLLGGQRHQRVINGAARDAQAAQRVRLTGARAAQHKRGRAGIHGSRHAIQQLAAVGTEAAGPANGSVDEADLHERASLCDPRTAATGWSAS